jgi:hypothetical protein
MERLATLQLPPAHHEDDLGLHAFLIVSVKRACDRAARTSLLHYLGSKNYLSIERGGFQEFDVHGAGPTGGEIGLTFHVHALVTAFQGEGGPGGMAINQSACDTAIEISRIGAVVRLRLPSAHGLVPLEETLEFQAVCIVRAASVTVPYGSFRMEAIL